MPDVPDHPAGSNIHTRVYRVPDHPDGQIALWVKDRRVILTNEEASALADALADHAAAPAETPPEPSPDPTPEPEPEPEPDAVTS